uniref:Putative trans-golgi network integral membrane protein tgn38 n=1 Tax=Panstrongylus lignarius TaxID=156445 RepID=A0A224XNU6_9HEMI
MCSNIVWLLSVFLLLIKNDMAITKQTLNRNDRLIKYLVLQDRRDCKIENSDQVLENHAIFDECEDKVLPLLERENFFRERDYILCFGYYEALYGLCEFYDGQNNLLLETVEDSKIYDKVCNFSHDIYPRINLKHTSNELREWSQYVNESMSNQTICSNLCVFLGKVDPKCTFLLNLLNHYNEVKYRAAVNQNSKISDSVVTDPLNNVDATALKNKDVSSLAVNQGVALQQNSPATKLEQSTNDNKNDNLVKQPTNIATLTNDSPDKEKTNEPAQTVQEKLPEQSAFLENANKINPVSSTTSSLLPQQDQQKESSIQHIPNESEKAGMDGLDEFDQENNPPSSEKEPQGAGPVEDDAKPPLDDKFDLDGEGVLKQGNQMNTNDMDIVPGGGEYIRDNFKEAEDSNFFAYFLVMTGGCIVVYVVFHNRNKLLALALEGRKGRSARARGGGRHSSASYSKLHSNLEEAIASNATTPSAANVLY